jgi:hypothetical protein
MSDASPHIWSAYRPSKQLRISVAASILLSLANNDATAVDRHGSRVKRLSSVSAELSVLRQCAQRHGANQHNCRSKILPAGTINVTWPQIRVAGSDSNITGISTTDSHPYQRKTSDPALPRNSALGWYPTRRLEFALGSLSSITDRTQEQENEVSAATSRADRGVVGSLNFRF